MDQAAAGNYKIEFDIQGEGEVVELAKSVRKMLSALSQK